MKIEPFGVEMWMNEYETKCEYNLAETCVYSLSVSELLETCGLPREKLDDILSLKLGYGAIEGSDKLRSAISALYENQAVENTIVTHGTIGANSLVHQSLLSRDDQIVAIVPSYQQHYSIPESVGARVDLLHLKAANNFLPDLAELKDLVTKDTKLIVLTNPNNPTGSLLNRAGLEEITAIAKEVDAWVLCDEVYRGTDQAGAGMTCSIVDIYEKGISTAGMSKAFSLAGLRLGWVVGPVEMIRQVMIHRDYNTISVGVINDYLATLALENHQALLNRSKLITRRNLEVLATWVDNEQSIDWVRPSSGTTTLLKYDLEMSSRDFCIELLEETGVMFTPGSAMGMEGYVRIGYANPTEVLQKGLKLVSEFLLDRMPRA
jgi:aspartate/methionine/tyrosine aminotransferase